jgi:hypothetical protein
VIVRAPHRAAVDVLAGHARTLARIRRRLKGIWPEPVPRPTPPVDAPPPRDVFASAAAEIAACFEPDGWRYSRSGPHLSRRDGPFTFQLRLTTGVHNVRGELERLDAARKHYQFELTRLGRAASEPPST